jgi:DNA-binding NarL/FixJ family response regulator/tetratricopeptide (TPR) repeat protein
VVRIASPTFVGRAAELAMLDEALDSAEPGHTATVLISGDAGVGKSRLLETWNERIRERGARIAAGSCLDLGESGPAYVAIVQAFRDLLAPLDPVAVDALVGSDRATLGRVIPELLVPSGAADGGEPVMPIAQTRLFDRLVRVLERASADTPLVLQVEDVHWADPSTRAFLVYLAANARSGRLLFVTTFRAEETGVDRPATSMLRELGRYSGAVNIDLLPFDPDDLREQLRGILGRPPANHLVAAIQSRSEGNALFAEELIASGDPATELPASIGAALLARTAGLSQDARMALRVASIAGRSASYDLLHAATALADDRLDAALREAVGAHVVEPDHAGERYRFRHALLQEAIYQDTLPGERRRLHAAVAQALAADTETRPDDPELASQLAYHWFEAKDDARALQASVAAGDAAMGQAAYTEALHHYERVLRLWDKAPSHAHVDFRHAAILERASRAAYFAGESQATIAYAGKALDELDAPNDTILRVHVLDELADSIHNMRGFDGAVEYVRRLGAIDTVGLPVREQMIVLASRASALRIDGDLAGSSVAASRASHLVAAIEDPETKGEAHLSLAWILLEDRDLEGAIAEARRARASASIVGDAPTEVRALQVIQLAYEAAGEHELAIAAARATRVEADRVGLTEWEGTSASMQESLALLRLGRIDESAQVIEAALLDPPALPTVLSQFHLLAAEVSIIRGAHEDASTHLKAALVPGGVPELERGWLATVRAELAIAEGRLDDVRSIVAGTAPRLANVSPWSGMADMIWGLIEIGLDAEATRVESARAAGDVQAVDEVRGVASTFLGYVDEVRRRRSESGIADVVVARGEEALMQGHLARIDGRDDPALWQAAAEAFPPRSRRALAARYRQAEAMLAIRAPRDEIRAVMSDAHAAAVEIGARPLAGRFDGLARRARIYLRPSPSAVRGEEPLALDDAAAPGSAALRARGLSDREIEVLTLVSAGFSNHEIGTRLFISDKTASVHVSHILRKLDATTRTDAATIGVRLGLPDVERDGRPA